MERYGWPALIHAVYQNQQSILMDFFHLSCTWTIKRNCITLPVNSRNTPELCQPVFALRILYFWSSGKAKSIPSLHEARINLRMSSLSTASKSLVWLFHIVAPCLPTANSRGLSFWIPHPKIHEFIWPVSLTIIYSSCVEWHIQIRGKWPNVRESLKMAALNFYFQMLLWFRLYKSQ